MVEVAPDRRDPPAGNQSVFVDRQGRSGLQPSQRQNGCRLAKHYRNGGNDQNGTTAAPQDCQGVQDSYSPIVMKFGRVTMPGLRS